MPPRQPIVPALALLLIVLGALLGTLPAAAQAGRGHLQSALQQAQALIDQGQAKAALPLLDGLLKKEPGNAQALLLRSTGRFQTGDLEGGRVDLDRALELDPSLRQGWLNRAGLDIAGKRYDAALASLDRAERLDPQAPDNDLNIGAVLLLQGKLEPASNRFQRYLGRQRGSADALYLVASNYALAGYASLAIEHLRQAIALEERARLRARTDRNFTSLGANPRFRDLLATDTWKAPAGARLAARVYAVPYDEEGGELLGAVLNALREVGERYDPRVESAPSWALVWGQDLRVKVSRTADGKGLVEVSAPPERDPGNPAAAWRQRTDKLFQQIAAELLTGQRSRLKRPAADRRPPG